MKGARLLHADLPIIPSPSGLPSQQWLQPGDEVFRHTHPCEEALMFLSGTGEASLGDETVTLEPGCSLFIPAGVEHGFRNTGETEMHVVIVFPVPHFAPTTMVD
jgi:quercetin dioxygenase-like cupin family protein